MFKNAYKKHSSVQWTLERHLYIVSELCSDSTSAKPLKECTTKVYTESAVPSRIAEIRNRRKLLLKESKISEITRKFQFEKYAISRLADNKIYDLTRLYLAIFHIGKFTSFENQTKISMEIKLKNEGLPIREGLHELYKLFCQERGFDLEETNNDLDTLRLHCRNKKENEYYIERLRINKK